MIDVERARRETPGCEHVIHLNNAGSALPPRVVHDAVVGHLELEAQRGGYEAHEQNEEAIERVYGAAAELLGCQEDEVAFCSSATRAWDMAFYGFPFERGDKILTAVAEYASNFISYLQVARQKGLEVIPVPSDEHGQVSVDELASLVDQRVKLIAITHVPTNGGLVNPAAEIGAIAKAEEIPYLLDACQSAGQMPLDVDDLGCDMLSLTGRKYLRGPRGTGLLYVRSAMLERLEPPFLDMRAADWVEPDRYRLRADAKRFEEWEQNYAAKVGLGVAIDYALGWGIDEIWARVHWLGESLRSRLVEIAGVTVRDLGGTRCGIVTFDVAGTNAGQLKEALARERINVPVSPQSSTLLDTRERDLPELVRASVHYYNTEEELDLLADCVRIAARC